MSEGIPDKPIDPPKGPTKASFFMRRVWDYLFGGRFPIKGVGSIIVEWVGGAYQISTAEQRRSATSEGALVTYRVKEKLDDALRCHTWDGTTEGTDDVWVAVNRNSRQLASETVGSTTYTYTDYSTVDSFNDSRNSNDGSTDETQIVTPMWYSNCEIDALATNYSGISSWTMVGGVWTENDDDIKLIEVSVRCWAKIST